jgi:hypothetical protein
MIKSNSLPIENVDVSNLMTTQGAIKRGSERCISTKEEQ